MTETLTIALVVLMLLVWAAQVIFAVGIAVFLAFVLGKGRP